METRPPSPARILVAAGFALSCFAILLFLWVTFGGPVPLAPQGYRFTADFPEAYTLSVESDVRIGGITVGKVKSLELAPHDDPDAPEATRVEVEIEPQYAPISDDARAILRQKTLIGETYVELTAGTRPGEFEPIALGPGADVPPEVLDEALPIPENGHLDDARVADATQIDEIFNALDEETRRSFQSWQANAAVAVQDRGLDINDAIGNLDPFLFDATDLLRTLDAERPAVEGLVRDTGAVFAALTEHESDLAGVITNSNDAFGALASEDAALAESFSILPTFQREARATLERLEGFRAGAEPVIDELAPVVPELEPTLAAVARFSPALERLFADVDRLIPAAERGLPALRDTLDELGPAFEALDPFLANLNPVARLLYLYRNSIPDFLGGPPSGVGDTLPIQPGQLAPRHILRQYAYTSPEVLAIFPERLASNRGNGYPGPHSLTDAATIAQGVFDSFDCKNTDYTPVSQDTDEDEVSLTAPPPADVNGGAPADPAFAPCFIAPGFDQYGLENTRAPIVLADP